MKKIFTVAAFAMLLACNNSKKDKETTSGDATTTTTSSIETTTATNPASPAVGTATVTYSIADTSRSITGSILVQKDKDKLSPGNEYHAMVTANSSGGESFVVNFLFDLKTGSYPVVGFSLTRENQVFGGILGGKPKITPYKVNLTQVDNLGSNGLGGNKWKISGTIDEEVTIDAMGIMKMDPNHPADIKVNKISFSNLTFDDNWEEMLEKAMDKLK